MTKTAEHHYLLALETSGKTTSFALLDDDRLVLEVLLNLSVQQKDSLALWVNDWFQKVGLSIKQLNGVTVSMGPGSFTGLRVGMSFAKGICLAQNIPLWSVPTLEAMANHIPPTEYLLCPTTIARKGECYAALYQHTTEGIQVVEPPFVSDAHGLKNRLNRPTWIWGEGALAIKDELASMLTRDQHIQQGDLFLPRASAVARCARKRIINGEKPAPPDLEPFYLKQFPG